jgi:hypothetical protein
VWRTRTPFLVRHPWILDWLESIKTRTDSDTTWRTDTANQRGGSEWEPIKFLLEGDGNSNKMNTASNTRLRLTTQIGQAHVATGVPLDLGTNTQPSEPRTQRNTKPRVHWPTPVRPVSTPGKTSPCWWNLATSTKWFHTGQAGATHRSDQSKPESPQINKQANRPPNVLYNSVNAFYQLGNNCKFNNNIGNLVYLLEFMEFGQARFFSTHPFR